MDKKAQASKGLLILLLLAFIATGLLAIFNKLPLFNLTLQTSGSGISKFFTVLARFIVAPALIVFCFWVIFQVVKGR